MSRTPTRLVPSLTRLVLCLALLTTGCVHDFLKPADTTPLPASVVLGTSGGFQLEIDAEGQLVVRPSQDDIEAALGATLEETAEGVTVANRLSTESKLEAGDKILAVWPIPAAAAASTSTGAWVPTQNYSDRLREVYVQQEPFGPGHVRAAGHPVTVLSDLRGYALSWVVLDVLVLRSGTEQVVRQEVGRPEPVPTRLWYPTTTRRMGFEACYVADLPEAYWPVGATEEDLLVSYVAHGSVAGAQGLRPLDLIHHEGVYEPAWAWNDFVEWQATGADGVEKSVLIPAPSVAIDIDFFSLWEVDSDDSRTHVGLLPLDVLFHYHSWPEFNPRTNTYADRWAWSFLTLFQVSGLGGDGYNDWDSVSLNPFIDEPRMRYYMERMDGRVEPEPHFTSSGEESQGEEAEGE
ncbi:hypothetical protein OAX78_03305 [Planctomycetota bacterium]|nr:hypothetical protein [Planctomycetota bacterium]